LHSWLDLLGHHRFHSFVQIHRFLLSSYLPILDDPISRIEGVVLNIYIISRPVRLSFFLRRDGLAYLGEQEGVDPLVGRGGDVAVFLFYFSSFDNVHLEVVLAEGLEHGLDKVRVLLGKSNNFFKTHKRFKVLL
jgi:hypothetical protein